MSGFVALHREAFSHPILKDAERFRAWFWLVAHAAYQPTKHDARGTTITVDRGQICAGRDYLAKQWGWSASAVERFLTRLETEHMIERTTGQIKTVITICNYDKYQSAIDETGQLSGHKTGQKPDRNRTTKEQSKQLVEGKDKSFPSTARAIRQEIPDTREAPDGPAEPMADERYAFRGRVARISHRDFANFKATFSGIPDLRAELLAFDGWLAGQPPGKQKNWFGSCAPWLNRRHQEALAEQAGGERHVSFSGPC